VWGSVRDPCLGEASAAHQARKTRGKAGFLLSLPKLRLQGQKKKKNTAKTGPGKNTEKERRGRREKSRTPITSPEVVILTTENIVRNGARRGKKGKTKGVLKGKRKGD